MKCFPNFAYLLLAAVILISCSEEDPLPDPGPNPNAQIVKEDAEINAAFTDTDNIALFALSANGQGLRTQVEFVGDLCAEAEVAHFPDERRIVVDFKEGCTSANGLVRKGKLLIDYTGVILFPGASVMVNFENYHVNGVKIEGTRTSTNRGINLNEGTITFETIVNNGRLTWEDGSQATVTINHNRKFILPGENEGIRAEITGTTSGNSRTGVAFNAEISEALVFFQNCTNTGNWIPSQGKSLIAISQAFLFEVDYGTGECDREITVRLEGETITLTLD